MSTVELIERFVKDEVAKWDSGPFACCTTRLHEHREAAPYPEDEGADDDETEEEGANVYRFLVSWSKPTKTRPVPETVVHATVDARLMASGPVLEARFEREQTAFSSEQVGKLLLPTLERLMDRKKRMLAACDVPLVEPFDRDRLPGEYVDDAEDDEVTEAAVAIQRVSRGKMARKRVAERRQEEKAAVAIQRAGRGRLARKRVDGMRGAAAAHDDAVDDDGVVEDVPDNEAGVLFIDHGSPEEEAAAVAIQRAGRGRLARKRVAGMADKAAPEAEPAVAAAAPAAAPSGDVSGDPDEEVAAVQVQRMARGRFARKRVETLKTEKEAATSVQRMARGRAARRRVTAIKEERSAVAIQRIARGKRDRQRVAKLKSEK